MKQVTIQHELTNGAKGDKRVVLKVVPIPVELTETLQDVTEKIFKGNIKPTTFDFKRGRRAEGDPERSLCDLVNSFIVATAKSGYENPLEKSAKLKRQIAEMQADLAKAEAEAARLANAPA